MTISPQTREILDIAVAAADTKLAVNPVALDVSGRMPFTDVFLIVSADTPRQVNAIANEIVDELIKHGYKRAKMEGKDEASWILIDCGDVIVHVMHDEKREFYALERLWADAPQLEIQVTQR
ncbi:ribosome silencing factor [Gleimia sp. 6138-11-ORH1]|uniref:ribosome silencing factor n=1 Tax=Gleimia sp. 6138-11-ORH1 TaxID=2973937 RepID=UPI0021691EA5|nr:ribosome silencing factor [Gleimia sp. 6138-11-ORH1]MCS4484497.1 ribosome silencing factor [Gleimia sp. 6138-11-ORH1]